MFKKKTTGTPATFGKPSTSGTLPNNSPAKKMGVRNLNKSGMKHAPMKGKSPKATGM